MQKTKGWQTGFIKFKMILPLESLLAAADARMYAMKHGQRRTASMVSGPSPADLSTAGAA